MMIKNVGAVDRLIRLVLGLIIIAWGVIDETWWGAIGVIPLFTGFINWCPLYVPFKISTVKRGDNKIKIG